MASNPPSESAAPSASSSNDDPFRAVIAAMHGYTPGEQPRNRQYVKLNTNENPYPPTPTLQPALAGVDMMRLARYPDPMSTMVREAAATLHRSTPDCILVGNGSDDILTIAVRSFVDQGGVIASLEPSYSLYPVLAEIQGARVIYAELDAQFQPPATLLADIAGASLFFLTRPNAPTGNTLPLDEVRTICKGFAGVVLIDEAYGDFADEQADALVAEFPNVIISRSLSKSYSLAGIRLGYAYAQSHLIAGMLKVKDSYNVNHLTQVLAVAALRDQVHMRANVHRIRHTRARVSEALAGLGFVVCPSEANFILVRPPLAAATYKTELQERGVLIRYFSLPRVKDYVRITIGTDEEMDILLRETRALLAVTR